MNLSAECQFWMNWILDLAVAVGTIGAVVVALFSNALRAWIIPPRLKLQLLNANGEKAKVQLMWEEPESSLTPPVSAISGPIKRTRQEDARYYHIRVSNQRRYSKANQLQVFLIDLKQQGPDGQWQIVWSGDVPLRWRHQELYPLSRTIGTDADCDFCSAVKNKWLELHPQLMPLNLTARIPHGTKYEAILSLQARSNEGDSSIEHVQISWDGKWEDGDTEMARHLIVKMLAKEI